MRQMLASAVVPLAAGSLRVLVAGVLAVGFLAINSLSGASAAHADAGPGATGNDTGGIIRWVQGMGHSYKEIAVEHCARYGRFAGISSVRRSYGSYIGFQCVYDRRYDPRKLGLPPPE
jgi:hypothetical protein